MEVKLDKPEYPKILEAYVTDKQGESLLERKTINDKYEEASFLKTFDKDGNIIREGKFTQEELKELPLLTRLFKITPKWVFLVVGIAIGIAIKKFLLTDQ